MCQRLHSAEGEEWGELAKANLTQLGGSGGRQVGRHEQRLRGDVFPWCWYGRRERGEGPRSAVTEKVKKKTGPHVGFVLVTKPAKAVEATVCIGKMSLEGAKKHMWD